MAAPLNHLRGQTDGSTFEWYITAHNNVVNYLYKSQNQDVMVLADKASNNIIMVCKKYYIQILIHVFSSTSNNTHIHLTITHLTPLLSNMKKMLSNYEW